MMDINQFTKVADSIYVREATAISSSEHPDVILIFGWGDASLRNVAKYSIGYHNLFPGAKQVVVLSSISSTLSSTSAQRTTRMKALVNSSGERTIVHVMSNTGAITYSGLLNAYSKVGKPFPHDLLVLDSTPGTPYLSFDTLKRWSWAMTINTARWFPWPALLTRAIWIIFLCVNRLFEKVLHRQSGAEFATIAVNDPNLEGKADKLFLYGKSDDLIAYTDIEKYAVLSRKKGYRAELVEFEGSGHVEHMKRSPDRYWKVIDDAWNRTMLD